MHQSLYCSLNTLLTPHITVMPCVNSDGVIMRETLPFQYTAKSYPVCSVYSSIGTRNFDMTVLRVMECFYRAQSLRAENVLPVIAVHWNSLCWYGDPVVGGAMVGVSRPYSKTSEYWGGSDTARSLVATLNCEFFKPSCSSVYGSMLA